MQSVFVHFYEVEFNHPDHTALSSVIHMGFMTRW